MNKKILVMLSFFLTGTIVLAAESSDLSVFKKFHEPKMPEIKLSTPVKITFNKEMPYGIAVIEKKSGKAQPWVKEKMVLTEVNEQTATASSSLIGNLKNLVDKNFNTEAEFNLDQDKGEAYIILEQEKPLTSDELDLSLGEHTALPHEIEIKAEVNGSFKTVVSRTRIDGQSVYFPSTTSQKWRIALWHAQPLSLKEITLVDQKQREIFKGENYIWLAKPGEEYLVYIEAQSSFYLPEEEGGNLSDEERTVAVEAGQVKDNPLYKEPDDDQDGVINLIDNCVNVSNKEQTDLDDNGRGDACEDHDGDAVMDINDNCPNDPNRYQENIDGDKLGDKCDESDDRPGQKMPWLPWLAMGIAGGVVLGIIVKTLRKK